MARTKQTSGSRTENTPLWAVTRRDLPYRLRIVLPSTKPAINRAVAQVCRLTGKCRCSEDHQTNVEIALREALANAVRHGNGNHSRRKVFLRCYAGPDTGILIAVRDEGQGFNPDSVPDPRSLDRLHLEHGRGLLLMRELMDGVLYRRGGREVVLYSGLPTLR